MFCFPEKAESRHLPQHPFFLTSCFRSHLLRIYPPHLHPHPSILLFHRAAFPVLPAPECAALILALGAVGPKLQRRVLAATMGASDGGMGAEQELLAGALALAEVRWWWRGGLYIYFLFGTTSFCGGGGGLVEFVVFQCV